MKRFKILAACALFASGLARAELVLIAHPALGVGELTTAQVSRLFLGQTDHLDNGTRVQPLNAAGPSREQFLREVLKRNPQQVDKYWARMVFTGKAQPPREVREAELKAVVAATPGALSYLEKSQVDGSVKVIQLKAD